MVECSKCGAEVNTPPIKEWEMKGRVAGDQKRHNIIIVQQYRCPACGRPFRKGIPKGGS